MRKPSTASLGALFLIAVIGAVLLGSIHGRRMTSGAPPLPAPSHAASIGARSASPAEPPWIYGRDNARFTVLEYADLECSYCRAYFPVLKRWIDAHAEVNWQWQHLPLPMHDPTATSEARLAECAGEVAGNTAFWEAVAWIYTHTRGDGHGLPDDAPYPNLTPPLERCLAGKGPEGVIRAQSELAAKNGITATPTLRLVDRRSGKSILLPGPADGDTLLSAIDWLASQQEHRPAEASSGSTKGELP